MGHLSLVAMCCAVSSSCVLGQIEPNASSLRFEVWDGTAWSNQLVVVPGARVEYRAVVNYTGTSTVPLALGSIRYQPTFSNIDNDGTSVDGNAPFRNNGVSGVVYANSTLTTAQGVTSQPLPTYGRVNFAGTAMQSSTLNVLTQFRHGGDFAQAGAPTGSWIRLAGSSVTTWPQPTLSAPTAAELNMIARGVVSSQASLLNPIGTPPNPFHISGTQNLVVFRGALLLSDLTDVRTITLSSAPGSQDRASAVGGTDDARFMTWQTSAFGGSYRTGVVVSDASIVVVPNPSGIACVALAAMVTPWRRRRTVMFGTR
ncbi:MAG TPA: hypothetical protein VK157_08545 [Phycisphaerales bacterium]|nr:hypothetical protein [Phycisphaerales bacterium]